MIQEETTIELTQKSKDVEEFYAKPKIHDQWLQEYRSPANEEFYDLAYDKIVRKLGHPQGATIFDIGCGNGALSD